MKFMYYFFWVGIISLGSMQARADLEAGPVTPDGKYCFSIIAQMTADLDAIHVPSDIGNPEPLKLFCASLFKATGDLVDIQLIVYADSGGTGHAKNEEIQRCGQLGNQLYKEKMQPLAPYGSRCNFQ